MRCALKLELNRFKEVLIKTVFCRHNWANYVFRHYKFAKSPRQTNAVAGVKNMSRPLELGQLITHGDNGRGTIGVAVAN